MSRTTGTLSTIRRRRALAVVVTALLWIALAVPVEPAAAADASQVGGNLGEILRTWATGLLMACAGFAGISALMRQDLGQAVVIFLITIFVGGFVFAGDEMEDVIEAVWSSATGTTEAPERGRAR